ncbi:NUDIX domain-containing protein [Actinokineospora sp. NBRC 105648]|uniref:NUDIX hydrolase n=1 Tax=Actinokineospora sp. NBRC 105648 TaxID=3032206 RepID=UPI0024A4BE95|nr:NUDIX domain-containing protein [Actinokineospora sp. NBRC 105648]GLZ42530.1 hypothetical protein Acsp05_61540 [Actinokineospora sp. NBRC 105648]
MSADGAFPLSRSQFDEIYGRVPRLAVEVLVRTDAGILLTKRGIEPCLGQWHLPGGTVYFGESLTAAVRRVALNELRVVVAVGEQLGYVEYPHLHDGGYRGWPVGIVFAADIVEGVPGSSEQTEEVGYFTDLPVNTMVDQAAFLRSLALESAAGGG